MQSTLATSGLSLRQAAAPRSTQLRRSLCTPRAFSCRPHLQLVARPLHVRCLATTEVPAASEAPDAADAPPATETPSVTEVESAQAESAATPQRRQGSKVNGIVIQRKSSHLGSAQKALQEFLQSGRQQVQLRTTSIDALEHFRLAQTLAALAEFYATEGNSNGSGKGLRMEPRVIKNVNKNGTLVTVTPSEVSPMHKSRSKVSSFTERDNLCRVITRFCSKQPGFHLQAVGLKAVSTALSALAFSRWSLAARHRKKLYFTLSANYSLKDRREAPAADAPPLVFTFNVTFYDATSDVLQAKNSLAKARRPAEDHVEEASSEAPEPEAQPAAMTEAAAC